MGTIKKNKKQSQRGPLWEIQPLTSVTLLRCGGFLGVSNEKSKSEKTIFLFMPFTK
jgi:hypothetical protein